MKTLTKEVSFEAEGAKMKEDWHIQQENEGKSPKEVIWGGSKGFTLIEFLVVIALLMGILLPVSILFTTIRLTEALFSQNYLENVKLWKLKVILR